MKPVDKAKSIKDTVSALKKVEAEIQCLSDKELTLLKSDINSILEQNKLSPILGVCISLLIFTLPLYFTSIKEMLMETAKMIISRKIETGQAIDQERVISLLSILMNFLPALGALTIALIMFSQITKLLENARYLSSLDKIIEGVIRGREIFSTNKDKIYEKLIEKKLL